MFVILPHTPMVSQIRYDYAISSGAKHYVPNVPVVKQLSLYFKRVFVFKEIHLTKPLIV